MADEYEGEMIMAKKIRILVSMIACTLFLGILHSNSALAGSQATISEPVSEKNELNQTDWYFADSNIVATDGTLVIQPTSTSDTRFIAKGVSKTDSLVSEMTSVEASMRLTALPRGKQFVLAFGLSSIEAFPGEAGNVEISFTNDGGVKMGIVAHTGSETVTILNPKNVGVSMNKEFTLSAVITPKAALQVSINGRKVCEQTLPVSGEGRFGVLQTGACGAKFSKLSYSYTLYERPENTNIYEDFETGDFNMNTLYSTSKKNGLYPSGIRIEDYNGSQVLRFQNVGLGYIATKHKYSNFEISFDMPYFLRERVYDENGQLIGKPASNLGISFGGEVYQPEGYAYVHDTDLITIRSELVRSESRQAWTSENLAELGVTDISTNEGYSVKLTYVDGHATFQVKALSAKEYITVGETDYELQRSGYIFIWSTGNADCAIDNLKIVNLDQNPNLIEVERRSSIITAEDYIPTKEELEPASLESVKEQETGEEKAAEGFDVTIFVVCCVVGTVVLVIAGAVIGSLLRRKQQKKEVRIDEKA